MISRILGGIANFILGWIWLLCYAWHAAGASRKKIEDTPESHNARPKGFPPTGDFRGGGIGRCRPRLVPGDVNFHDIFCKCGREWRVLNPLPEYICPRCEEQLETPSKVVSSAEYECLYCYPNDRHDGGTISKYCPTCEKEHSEWLLDGSQMHRCLVCEENLEGIS